MSNDSAGEPVHGDIKERPQYAYRFEYADGSAFEIDVDGRAFITKPNGSREEKRGWIDNRIPLLIGAAAKPRQDRIEELEAQLAAMREAIEPFVSLRDQGCEAVKVINKTMDGLTPVTVTVTKAQYKAAMSALTGGNQ